MAAHPTLTEEGTSPLRWSGFSRLTPAGQPWTVRNLLELARHISGKNIQESLLQAFSERFPDCEVDFHASGRAALAWAFRALADRTARSEVIIPAYTCYSVPAAAVAAGLRVRLVDINPRGQVDIDSLTSLPIDRAAAVVVTNLLGVPERIDSLKAIVSAAGSFVIEDAAQSFGGSDESGAVGSRGEMGILSFGRGKPLSALGGGAALYSRGAFENATGLSAAVPNSTAVTRAIIEASAYNVALWPWVFRGLSAIPGLGIGETHYDPSFGVGVMAAKNQALLMCGLQNLDQSTELRRQVTDELVRRIGSETAFSPLIADEGFVPVYPRLGILAPTAGARDSALAELNQAGAGASQLYPKSLDLVEGLRSHRVGDSVYPGAQEFAQRLLTLPTHGRLRGARLARVVSILKRLGRDRSRVNPDQPEAR